MFSVPSFPTRTVIRRASLEQDAGFVAALAELTLGTYGDYGRLVPEWMERADVSTTIAVQDGHSVAFSLLTTFKDPQTGPYADLLAIAVEPSRQRSGIGRMLLRHAVREAEGVYPELRLSVAETNTHARALFEREGFVYIHRELGTYSRGQLALRMSKSLPA